VKILEIKDNNLLKLPECVRVKVQGAVELGTTKNQTEQLTVEMQTNRRQTQISLYQVDKILLQQVDNFLLQFIVILIHHNTKRCIELKLSLKCHHYLKRPLDTTSTTTL
jgi:hypothetical protein